MMKPIQFRGLWSTYGLKEAKRRCQCFGWIRQPPLYMVPFIDRKLLGSDNQPGDDMLGAGAVKTNHTDRFNSVSLEKIHDGDNAGMLEESAVDPALPTVLSQVNQQIRMNHLWRRSLKGRSHMWLNFTG